MGNTVLIETSARHVHVTEADLVKLFGEGAKLTVKKMLSQPGQFASEQKVNLVGPKKEIANVSILGPCRKETQVEISATDARTLGVDVAIRESGNIKGTPGIKLVGPAGEIELAEGVIVAKRHIHLTPEDAKEMGLADVVFRVNPNVSKAMHIDTDESNAGCVAPGTYGEVIK